MLIKCEVEHYSNCSNYFIVFSRGTQTANQRKRAIHSKTNIRSTCFGVDIGGLVEGKVGLLGPSPVFLFLSRRSPNLTKSTCSFKWSLSSLEGWPKAIHKVWLMKQTSEHDVEMMVIRRPNGPQYSTRYVLSQTLGELCNPKPWISNLFLQNVVYHEFPLQKAFVATFSLNKFLPIRDNKHYIPFSRKDDHNEVIIIGRVIGNIWRAQTATIFWWSPIERELNYDSKGLRVVTRNSGYYYI